MKGRRRVLLIVMACCLALLAAVFWSRKQEPVYQGKTLTEWLFYEQPASAPTSARNPQSGAIRAIGTNALPWLLTWARYEKAGWQRKLPFRASRLGIEFVPGERAADRAAGAWTALRILGPEASPAIPELSRMMADPNSPLVALDATITLGAIGPEALPALLVVLTNKQVAVRGQAVTSIGAMRGLGTNASLAVPGLLSCLKDKDEDLAASAANSLGRLAAEPGVVVPALADSLQHPAPFVRRKAAAALGKFSQSARGAVPSLIVALKDSDSSVREEATNSVMRIAPEVLEKMHGTEGTGKN